MQHFLYFLPLPHAQGSFRPILAISPTSFQRTDPVYQAVLADAKFHEQLLVFDRDLAASVRAARCWLWGGALHSASYDRKPRGCPGGLGQEYAERFSFCCAVDGCRKRTTPPSLRFLGRKVYLATVVTLVSALLLGTPGAPSVPPATLPVCRAPCSTASPATSSRGSPPCCGSSLR